MTKIIIVGLGAGDINQLPLGVYKLLKNDYPLFLRTKEHPVVESLEQEGVAYFSFDAIYEKNQQFTDVYEEIVEKLFSEASDKDIVYAVPGAPIVAERTVQLLLERREEMGIEIELAGGQSFLDALFQAVRIDPIEGFQLLDGTNFNKYNVQLTQHMIIGQVYDQMVASNVKLELMELLPDTYEIYIVENAGSAAESVKKVPLYLLDHEFSFSNLTSLYIPQVKDERILYKNFTYLRQVVATLRSPNGCPWDREQTHQSLKKYLIEEAYELLEAIDENDDDHMVEELGDVLLQIMLHAQIGEDEGYFTIDDVIEAITSKMIRRHPHVFGDKAAKTVDEVLSNWQNIKQNEEGREETRFAAVKKGLPALLQAYELQKMAKNFGFDWQEIEPVIEKLKEELDEWLIEVNSGVNKDAIELEYGDLLFSMVNIARFLSIHPEEALIRANQKFVRRFQYIEEKINKAGRQFSDYTLEELDSFWNEAKENGL